MALQEGLAMELLPNWLDARRIPIENGAGDEEIPAEGRIGRPYGKSRLKTDNSSPSWNPGMGGPSSGPRWRIDSVDGAR